MWLSDGEGSPLRARPAPGIARRSCRGRPAARSPAPHDADGVRVTFPRHDYSDERRCLQLDDEEEADSGLGSGGEASLGALAPPDPEPEPAPPPPAPATPRLLLALLGSPGSGAEVLREVAAARALYARVEALRDGAAALRLAAAQLREEMQDSEVRAQTLGSNARRLAEELRELQHLDALVHWLQGPPPDVAFAALPDDDDDDGGPQPCHGHLRQPPSVTAASSRRPCSLRPPPPRHRRRVYSV